MKKKVLAIMWVAVSIMLISACGKKEKLYEIPDLSQYKTDYVGDSSNVINIVSGQEYPEGYSYDSIEIQSETEPYGLTVFLKDEPSAGFRRESSELLSQIKQHSQIPLITKLADAQNLLDSEGNQILSETVFSSHLYEKLLCLKTGRKFCHESQKQLIIL